tara:strand:- start:890 stop:1231 length:342 start_codon:yes stop_codon:yes gene_type:complete
MQSLRRFSFLCNNVYRKQLIYRSKQRGWLEVDLILGSWATDNVMKLSDEQLEKYEYILNQDTLDIYNSIIGRGKIDIKVENDVMNMIRDYSQKKMLLKTPDNYEKNIKSKMSN